MSGILSPFPFSYWGTDVIVPSLGIQLQRSPVRGTLSRSVQYDGVVDSKKWLFSAWFKMSTLNIAGSIDTNTTTLDSPWQVIWNGHTPEKKMSVFALKAVPPFDAALEMRTQTSIPANSGWHHLAFSVDMAGGSSMYLNGVSDIEVITYVDELIRFTASHPFIGAAFGLDMHWDGCLAEVYSNYGVSGLNINKFITPEGKPVDLGSDGSIPTGSPPVVYVKGPKANWSANFGTGGDFTLSGGSFDCADSP